MDRATFESLAGGLRRFGPVSDAALEGLRAIAHAKQFAAGEFLLRAGERAEQCYLLTGGLVREFYLDERGHEHNRSFLAAGDITGSLLDLLSGRPAVTYIQALEPTATLCWDYARFDGLCARFGELQLE